ncbi:hypothetical protein IF1G_11175 [Cordyceps javanica]|uniref:Uncharacterized protein n=1 Tax=Cordyceps javanica TaxID=43265 RepID=A0A545UL38_9HYPO|nr:hypothetical protein IF1G_11175 [Cordyceps javanica]
MAVPMDTTPAAQILDRVVAHVVQSINEFHKIPSPQCRFTQRLTELTAQLERCTARLRQPRPQPGVGPTTEDQIVHYANEIKTLKKNGLHDLEKAYQDEVACVLQTVTDLLTTTIHPSFVKRSLQKIATGELRPYFSYDLLRSEEEESTHPPSECAGAEPDQSRGVRSDLVAQHDGTGMTPQRTPNSCDPWLDDRLKRHAQNDEERPSAKRRRFVDAPLEQGMPGATSAQANTTAAFEASVPQLTRYGGTARNDHSSGRGKVAFQIVDADDRLVAVLEQAGPWGNKRVDTILHMPIQRAIMLRRGLGFDQRQLNAICDPSDEEGVRIVACMIQACGDVMGQPCLCCAMDGAGPFDTCIMVHDELFSQCGNCAWNRQLCRGTLLTAEEGTSPSLEARATPEGVESTTRLNRSSPLSQSEDVVRRSLVSDYVLPGPVSPGRQSQSDIASTTTSSDL